ncbi:MAG: SpoIID/LytB domain-containing protein [Acidaminococcales bacterium]|jgi:stage II sporulation protein D|nr:SpoIID/LytB domain-containing protein [Acidaminococcales bacterium]
MTKRTFLAFFLLVFWGTSALAATGPNIRVSVVTGQRSALIAAQTALFSARLDSGEFLDFLPEAKHLLTAENGFLKIDGRLTAGKSVTITSETAGSAAEVNRKVFRGAFKVSIAAGGEALNVVNVLPVEEYLYGTVPNEIPPLWPEEAMRAQAVISRTIAFCAIAGGRQKDFDLPALYQGNAYYGRDIERPEITEAIRATAGQVVIRQGEPIRAFFHAAGGGRTEELAALPYIRSVVDYDQDCPDFEWKKTFNVKFVDERLKYAGHGDIGRLRGFEFSALEGAETPDRGKSGRLVSIKVLGDRGFAVIKGEEFAAMLDLPSGAFDIAIANLLPESIDVPISDPYGNVVGVKKIPVTVNAEPIFPAGRPLAQRVSWADNEKIIVKGRGKGSGLGYSQWGGRGLALAGKSHGEILGHYFPGTQIGKMY